MKTLLAWLPVLGGAALLADFAVAVPTAAKDLTFLSTQLRPLEEAQRTRTQILIGSPVPVDFVPEEPPQARYSCAGGHEIRLALDQLDRCLAWRARTAGSA